MINGAAYKDISRSDNRVDLKSVRLNTCLLEDYPIIPNVGSFVVDTIHLSNTFTQILFILNHKW